MTQYREILRLFDLGISKSSIAKSLSCSRNTVRKVINLASELNIQWPLEDSVTDAILGEMFFSKPTQAVQRKLPDMEYLHKELLKAGVTKRLLWAEYCSNCRDAGETPLMYSRFCYHYQQYAQKKHATMHINRKPAETVEVDWAGQTAHICDRNTGELVPVYIFVATLPYSLYSYVEACGDMKMNSWINAHVRMYQFFGGTTKTLVPDNLKVGVNRVDWHDPEINQTYRELSEHYNTAVIPARVRHPKDKASVEGTVGKISTWIIAALRNQQYFSITELNRDIRMKLDIFNKKPFQKKEGSRQSIFLAEEKPLLHSLPSTPYETSEWKQATVQFNYHIFVDKNFYSVPYEYIKHKVDVRLTNTSIEVFYQHNRICSHPRLHGKPGLYSTLPEHMPESHRKYQEWNGERFISWAETIGVSTTIVIKYILQSRKVEQQSYRSCMGVLKLADTYSVARLERACARALYYSAQPSYKNIKAILQSGQDKVALVIQAVQNDAESTDYYGFTRGADYYGGDE